MEINIKSIKQRFGIIGGSPLLDRAIEVAVQVAPTDMSVLIIGESGVGKESFPKIIHQNSQRKHNAYIAVNCGAIPEGTIDSELFGHLKGSFTGANNDRKGYFQEANEGTIFLDEVGELPLSTQARLLRVLETGEFIPVGASQPLKTNVRIVAATNVNLQDAVRRGRFREDLLFRLNTVPIELPPLRKRREDIALLFRYFASEAADKYHMPPLRLERDATELLEQYHWPGNIRELRNLTDRISVLEEERQVTAETLKLYLPAAIGVDYRPALRHQSTAQTREQEPYASAPQADSGAFVQILLDMRREISELRGLVTGLMQGGRMTAPYGEGLHAGETILSPSGATEGKGFAPQHRHASIAQEVEVQEVEELTSMGELRSLEEVERELIVKALHRHGGRRRPTAEELGISERTLYRKIKEYDLPSQ